MNIAALKPLTSFIGYGPFRSRAQLYRAVAAGDVPTVTIAGRKHTSPELITAHLERKAGLAPAPTTPTADRRRTAKLEAELDRRGL